MTSSFSKYKVKDAPKFLFIVISHNRVNREGNGYEGRQTSKGELFVKVFGMSRDFEGAHIDFKMAASV